MEITQTHIPLKLSNKELFLIKSQTINLFSVNTIINSKYQRIIIMVGGWNDRANSQSNSIILYNCMNHELYIFESVLPLNCSMLPSTLVHNDHLHILQQYRHIIVNLNLIPWLLPNKM